MARRNSFLILPGCLSSSPCGSLLVPQSQQSQSPWRKKLECSQTLTLQRGPPSPLSYFVTHTEQHVATHGKEHTKSESQRPRITWLVLKAVHHNGFICGIILVYFHFTVIVATFDSSLIAFCSENLVCIASMLCNFWLSGMIFCDCFMGLAWNAHSLLFDYKVLCMQITY